MGALEWWLFFRRAKRLEVPLGIVSGLIAAFAIFGFLANLGEDQRGATPPPLRFWIGFGSVCFGIATYAGWCCYLRVTSRTFVESEGFPVVTTRPAPDQKVEPAGRDAPGRGLRS